eukprot:CAMPEP_0205800936 /NCGR_PEP_ID=MMETSP0205-20121125/2750_1 /ASSEMBLY_ACC=CAM_ASM_000278 /TAXON_ID=36767 /ORGANISM="Euplotes focardii, Strain TN1" /LENGTH=157 /DNA_ID=CAMNT_0053064833 /DNA_START=273 /DNA_END=746 /DNA_ORIENTATION=-
MPKSTIPKGQGIYFDKLYESDASSDEEDQQEEDRRPRNYEQDNDVANSSNNQEQQQRLGNTNGLAAAGGRQGSREGNNGMQNPTSGNVDGNRITIHNDRANKWEDLNNVVRSGNSGQVYKSSESIENSVPLDSKVAGSNVVNTKFTNKIDQKSYQQK